MAAKRPKLNIRRPGYIYVMRENGLYKIGCSINPEKRRKQIPASGWMMREYHGVTIRTPDLIASYPVDNMLETERQLQRLFNHKRVMVRCEWFRLTEEDLQVIERLLTSAA